MSFSKAEAVSRLQTKEQSELRDRVLSRFLEMRKIRDMSLTYFGDMTLQDMLDIARKNYHSYIAPKSQDKQEWQARVFLPYTNNKGRSLTARVTGQRMKIQFFEKQKKNRILSRVMQTMYEHGEELENFDLVFEQMTEETLKDGTLIGFEGWSNKQKDVVSQLIPIDQFYPGIIHTHDVQKIIDCVWVSRISYDEFKRDFGGFTDADLVMPGHTNPELEESELYDYYPQDFGENEVYIIRYFNSFEKKFIIIANNVLIRGMKEDGKEDNYPWNYGGETCLPFWKAVNEPYSAHFFYGKPLAIKLLSDQSIANMTWEQIIDQERLAAHKPITTTDSGSIPQDLMVPGLVVQRMPDTTYDVIDIPSPNEASFQVLKLAQDNINLSTSDPINQGAAGQREITAKEAVIAREAALQGDSLFIRSLENAMKQKAEIRMKNMLKYYPSTSNLELLGIEDNFSKVIRQITVDDKDMRYRKTIKITNEQPTMGDVMEDMKEKVDDDEEIIRVPASLIKNLKFLVKVIPNSSIKETASLRVAKFQSVVAQIAGLAPQKLDLDAVAKRLVELAEEDPTDILKEEEAMQPQQLSEEDQIKQLLGEGGQEMNPQASTTPFSEQMMRTETRQDVPRAPQLGV